MPKPLGDLSRFVVQVLGPLGTIEGTGFLFLCHRDGYVLTCWHVMESWGQPRGIEEKEGRVQFGDQAFSARWLTKHSDKEADLAVLKLISPIGRDESEWLQLDVLDLHRRVRPDDTLESFGYPRGQFEKGISVRPKLQGFTPTQVKGLEAKLYPLMGFNLDDIREGYSGAPVINTRTEKVIGLVDARRHDTQAFMVPLAPLFDLWPELKDYHDIYRHIREQFAKDAQGRLLDHLRGTPFIRFRLEQGVLPKKASRSPESEQEEEKQPEREWQPLAWEQLLAPADKQILLADAGTGKTTLLYRLAAEIGEQRSAGEKAATVPILLSCREFDDWKEDPWASLKKHLVRRYEARFLPVDLTDLLDESKDTGNLVFLLDGLDQIEKRNYSELVSRAFDLAPGNALLISARPSAVQDPALQNNPDITLLRLKPFSVDDQKEYFGKYYTEATRLRAMAPELTQIPMLAFMVRTLLKKPSEVKDVRTRTDLHGKFVDHILKKHEPSARLLAEWPSLPDDAEQALNALAYFALDNAKPQIQRIEARLYRKLNQPIKIEDLTKFGLVNYVLEQGEKQLLFFTHQSFQEFLAARYIAEDDEQIRHVLNEQWNPKWEEVIRFLAGLKGEKIIREIYAQDNSIHAPLFLAAACCGENVALSPDTRDFVFHTAAKFGHEAPFQADAVRALAKGGYVDIDLTLELAMVSAQYTGRYSSSANEALHEAAKRLSREHINQLISRIDTLPAAVQALGASVDWPSSANEALREAAKHLSREHISQIISRIDTLPAAVQALDASVDRLAPEHLDALIAKVHSQQAASVLEAAANRLESKQLHVLIAKLGKPEEDKFRKARQVLESAADHLGSEHLDALMARLDDPTEDVRRGAAGVLGAAAGKLAPEQIISVLLAKVNPLNHERALKQALKASAYRLPPEHLDSLIARLGCKPSADQLQPAITRSTWSMPYYSVLKEVVAELLPGQLHALIAKLDDPTEAVRWEAAEVLVTAATHLASEHLDALIVRLGDPTKDVRKKASEVVKAAADQLEPKHLNKLIARLNDPDPWVRVQAIIILGSAKKKLAPEHIDAMAAKLDDPDAWVRGYAVETLAAAQDLLPPEHFDELIDKLDDPKNVKRYAEVALPPKGLAPKHIDALLGLHYEADFVLRKIAKHFGSEHIDRLIGKLSDPDEVVRELAVKTLRAAKERLEGKHIDAMSAMLDDLDRRVRDDVVTMLGVAQERPAPVRHDDLIARLDDPVEGKQSTAASALCGDAERLLSDEISKLLEWGDRQVSCPFGQGNLENLVPRLCKSGQLRSNHLHLLVTWLNRPDWWELNYKYGYKGALSDLGKQLRTEHLDAVLDRLDYPYPRSYPHLTEDGRVVKAAYHVLWEVDGDRLNVEHLRRLIPKLDKPDWFIYEGAAKLLKRGIEKLGQQELEACVASLANPNSSVREAMVAILSTAGRHSENASLIPEIEANLEHEYAEARILAYDVLMHLYRAGVPLHIHQQCRLIT
jgi:hypothetical protein